MINKQSYDLDRKETWKRGKGDIRPKGVGKKISRGKGGNEKTRPKNNTIKTSSTLSVPYDSEGDTRPSRNCRTRKLKQSRTQLGGITADSEGDIRPYIAVASLHDHFNWGRLSIKTFSSQSKVIKKLSKWKKKKLGWKKASIESCPRIK